MECRTVLDQSIDVAGENSLHQQTGGHSSREERRQDPSLLLNVEIDIEDESDGGTEAEGDQLESLVTETAEPGGDGGELPISKELIRFSLFGKMPAKFKRPWNESLSTRIAEVQHAFKNIPQMLYFSPSSVAFDGIGVYAAEALPKDTLLGPYLGKAVRKEQVERDQNNEWLWEVYEDTSLSYFIDARDPKYGNWMNFIQCARNSMEQNLRMAQFNDNIYFVVTSDIVIGDELLVWYDQQQYDLYMGLPTGFREIPPPPLFLEQQQQTPQESASNEVLSHGDHGSLPVSASTYPSCCSTTSMGGGSTFSDGASTDDSGISLSMETNGGPTPPLPPTYDLSAPRHTSVHHTRDGSLIRDSGRFERPSSGTQMSEMMMGSMSFSSSSDSGYRYARIEPSTPDHLHWYNKSPLVPTSSSSSDIIKLVATTTPDHSPAHTPSESSTSWIGPNQSFVENPSHIGSIGLLHGGVNNKKQLLYGLFSRCEDGSRWHCEECKRLFSSQGSLRAHARIHTGERPYQCQYCFRAFCQASTLRSHERLHTGEKPYKCDECGRAFTQSAGLRSHRKTHRYDS